MRKTALYLAALFALPSSLNAQHDLSLYQKNTRSQGSTESSFYPWYMYSGKAFLDARYNFDWEDTAGVFIGKSFGGEKLSVVPTMGALFGPNYKGLSPQMYFMGKGKSHSFTLLNQYSVGLRGSNDYVYNWYEVFFAKPLPWLELGMTEQTFYELADGSEVQVDFGPGLRTTFGKTYQKIWYALSSQAGVSKLYLTFGVAF